MSVTVDPSTARVPGSGDWRRTEPARAVSEPSSTTLVSKLPSSRATAASTSTPRTSGTDARGGPLETTMPIGPGLVASSPPATSLEITRPSGISHDSSVRTLTAKPVRRKRGGGLAP